jgi:NO-binding membrane sensor protein with MHYT domain
MLRVYGCIADHHNLSLVVLAGLICFVSCYTALSVIARARPDIESDLRNLWLAGAMVVTGCWADRPFPLYGWMSVPGPINE